MLLMIFIASVIRVIGGLMLGIISRDTTRFITMAYAIQVRDLDMFMEIKYHPLYPLLIYLFHALTPSWIVAAQAAAIVMSILTIIPLYYFARDMFGDRPAIMTAFLFAIHPYAVRFGVDGLSESTYIFCLISSLYVGYRSFVSERALNRMTLLFAAGSLAALAYLTRPEGLGVAIVLGITIWVYRLSKNNIRFGKRVTASILLCGGVCLFTIPYMYAMKEYTGQWQLTLKKPLSAFVPGPLKSYFHSEPSSASDHAMPPDRPKRSRADEKTIPEKFIVPAINMGQTCINTFHPLLFLFFLIGLYRTPWRKLVKEQRLLIMMTIGLTSLYLYILYKLSMGFYISKRHCLPLVILMLPFCARGAVWLAELPRVARFMPRRFKPLVVLMIVLAIVILPKTLSPHRWSKRYIFNLGTWVKTQIEPNAILAVDEERIPFYANLDFFRLPCERMRSQHFKHLLDDNYVRYLLLKKDYIDRYIDNPGDQWIEQRIKVKSIFKKTDDKHGVVEYYLYEYFPQ